MKHEISARIALLWKVRWLRRGVIALPVSLALYAIGGFVGVPLILRHVVLAKANSKLVGTMEVGHFRFNPFTCVLKVEDFKGRTPDGEVAASFAEFKVNFQPSSILGDAHVVREVLWDQPHCKLHIDAAGRVNLSSLFGLEDGARTADSTDSGPFVIPSLVIEHLEVRDAGLQVRIETFDPPFEREVEKLSFVMKNLRADADHDNPYRFKLVTADDERVAIGGSLRFDPLSAAGRFSVEALKLPGFSSFGSALTDAQVGSGVLDLQFDYRFRPLAEQPELGVDGGSLVLRDFTLVEPGSGRMLQRIGALKMDGVGFDLSRRSLRLDSLEMDGASLQLERGRQGGVSLAGIAMAAPKSAPKPVSSGDSGRGAGSRESPREIRLGVIANGEDMGLALTKASQQFRQLGGAAADWSGGPEAFSFSMQQCRIHNGRVQIRDESIQPVVAFGLHDIEMAAGPYASSAGRPLEFELSMSLAEGASGSIEVQGGLVPTDPLKSSHVKMAVNGVTMPPFAGYLVAAVGRAPTAGRLSAQLSYHIQDGKIEGSNDLRIEQIEFGPRVEDSKAPKLPLGLAIAILKDAQGVMTLDLPVSGNIADPQFSYGGMVAYAVHNVIEKIVTAPFKALGGLLGDEGKVEMGFIEFAPGQSRLPAAGSETLAKLAEILQARPGLALQLTPAFDAKVDASALLELRFEQGIAKLLAKGRDRKQAIRQLHQDLPRELRASRWGLADAQEMEAAVRKSLTATGDDLRELAEQRARAVQQSLEGGAGIKASRIKLVTPPASDSRRVHIGFDAVAH